jgi:CBS domain-containing protein
MDVMTKKVESVGPLDTLEHAQMLMQLRGIHHLVVVDRHQVVGLLSDGPLQTRIAEGVKYVEDAMSRHVVTGTPDMTIREAANRMRGRADGALPVLRGRHLVGIVTVSDLLDLIGRGVERPVAHNRRWTLRHRGVKPAAAQAAGRRST